MMEIELDMDNEVICAAVWFYPDLNWGSLPANFRAQKNPWYRMLQNRKYIVFYPIRYFTFLSVNSSHWHIHDPSCIVGGNASFWDQLECRPNVIVFVLCKIKMVTAEGLGYCLLANLILHHTGNGMKISYLRGMGGGAFVPFKTIW